MTSCPIIPWQIEEEKVETVTYFIFLGSKMLQTVTAAMKWKDTCSFRRKAMINLDSILKSRDITLLTKVCLVEAMVFPVMYGCGGFPCGSAGKESAYNPGDLGLIPGLERSPGEGKGYPLHYSGLENSMDCIVHGIAKSWTWLSNFHMYGCESWTIRLSAEELMFLNCGAGEDSWESLGQQRVQTSQS